MRVQLFHYYEIIATKYMNIFSCGRVKVIKTPFYISLCGARSAERGARSAERGARSFLSSTIIS